jgi:phosphomannomutase/phosphomannomutase/phosphoglucomutase
MAKIDSVVFREYDIRGVYNEQFDKNFAVLLGRAYASYWKKKTGESTGLISLGHDARSSSPEIIEGLKTGLNSSGLDVLLLGMVTTPISYFSTFAVPRVKGSITVTGSHNPPEYNGFKICVGKSTIFGSEIQELRKIIESDDFTTGTGTVEKMDIFPTYIERYKKEFGQMGDIKVVLDCGNGAAGCIARRLFEAVGLHPEILFEEPDGRFPNHHPDPTVEKNLKDLQVAVTRSGARAGIGFDGDCDRIGVVDDKGRMIYGDELMMVYARSILKESKGQKIIGDVKCSDRLYHEIEKNGGVPIMWKTGHSLIKEKIKVEKAPFGGEMSGHIFFADRNYGYDDALYAALRLVEILVKTGKTISQLLEGIPSAFNTPEIRVDPTEEKKNQIVEKLRSVYSASSPHYKVSLLDGIRVSYADGWALARASNTQPVLVLRYESNTQAGLDRIRNEFEKVVQPLL